MPTISAPGLPDINQPSSGKTVRGVRNIAANASAYLPYVLNSLFGSGIMGGNALSQANLDALLKYGPQFASAEIAANKAGKEGEVNTDLGLLQGGGKGITEQTLALNKLADPEFFKLREAISNSGLNLIAGQDPNKLSEAEMANVERAQNRSNIGRGTAGSGSNTAAIGNALAFDTKLQNKRQNLLNTLTNLGGLAPGLRSGAFNYGNATGAAGSGAGLGTFQNTFNTAQQQAGQITQNLLGQSGGVQQQRTQINATKVPNWERVVSSLPDYS